MVKVVELDRWAVEQLGTGHWPTVVAFDVSKDKKVAVAHVWREANGQLHVETRKW